MPHKPDDIDIADAIARQQRKRERLAAMARIEARWSEFRPPRDGKDTLALLREDRDEGHTTWVNDER